MTSETLSRALLLFIEVSCRRVRWAIAVWLAIYSVNLSDGRPSRTPALSSFFVPRCPVISRCHSKLEFEQKGAPRQQVMAACSVTQSAATVEADCGQNVDLGCSCYDGTDFLLLSWYKKGERGRHFIISMDDGHTETDDFCPGASFGKNYGLSLPAVRPGDSGTYNCVIAANVGGQNQNCVVDLLVHGGTIDLSDSDLELRPLSHVPQAFKMPIEHV
ncbi:uncharacterized protein LOC133515067 isoform X2 [Syngnathoides biaculeatus]|uniref:uncharacterized protein LOC133515067 isoform X2 n=1 Tax=Syngnathoides biaculeatus TaxID=300417 RepID=UPI002ADE5ACD|nr:uncharacterized protein LOC133515067 isoform X2 [Syngnathoides biaculeatus]